MTTLTDRPDVVGGSEVALRRRIRALTITVVVLAVAVLGLGAWVIYDLTVTPETAVTEEVQAVLDDYLAAWNEYDGDAFMALVTDNYEFGFVGDTPMTAEEIVVSIERAAGSGWHVELIGEPMMIGEGPWTVAAQMSLQEYTNAPEDTDGMLMFVIVDDGGTLKVASHWIGGPGTLD